MRGCKPALSILRQDKKGFEWTWRKSCNCFTKLLPYFITVETSSHVVSLPVPNNSQRRLLVMRLLGSLFLLVLCLGMAPQRIMAQTPAAPAASPATATAQTPTTTPTTEYTLPPDKLAKAKALYDLRGKLRIIDTAYSLIVLLAILSLGVAAKYRDWAEKVSGNRFVQALIFIPLLLLTLTVLGLPLDAYQQSISLK